MRKTHPLEVVVVIMGVLLLAMLILPLPRPSRPRRRTSCLNNLRQQGLALTQYSQDYDGCYPWRVGVSDTGEAWKDLAMLFPDYNSSWESFICPSSMDREFDPMCASGDKKDYPLEPLLSSGTREVVSYAYCFDARDPEHPKPWTEEARATVRLMADKKAGYRIGHAKNPATWANHKADGRNVLYHDGHVKWKGGMDAIDPDETDDEVGAPSAADYRAWWSDPPFYRK